MSHKLYPLIKSTIHISVYRIQLLCILLWKLFIVMGFVPSKGMQTALPPPPLKFCSHFHERGAMCLIKWKTNFSIYIFQVIGKIHRKLAVFITKMIKTDHNSENENRKNLIHDFSFVSAHSASFIKIWALLKGVICISLVGKKPTSVC